jgi:prepilin-type N-terminal cleavage/methylation domain-containing protein
MKSSQGFTLIELLVVISIIALLSSVVVSAVSAARAKGADGAVKAAMRQTRAQAQIYRDTQPNFGVSVASCTDAAVTPHLFKSDPKTVAILANIAQNIASGATISCRTDSGGNNWAISVSALRSAGTTWCIDNSQGWFKVGTANASGRCQ